MSQGYFRTRRGRRYFPRRTHSHRSFASTLAFNSPVWFNVGCDRIEPNSDGQQLALESARPSNVEFGVTGYRKPQCSACFINSVQDSLDSILTLAKTEGMLFKWGIGHRHQSLDAAFLE